MKTVRFAKIVERSGQPRVHTLWVAPEKDSEFKRAREANRVMTVERSAAGKAESGFVGFKPAHKQEGRYLVFPKSLRPFEGARVIGIKYDLVDEPKSVLATALTASHHAPRRPPPRKQAAARPVAAARNREPDEKVVPFTAESAEPRHTPVPAVPPKTSRAMKPQAKTQADSQPAPDAAKLAREIRAAMKELQRGKSVAAYQRLERALADE